MKSPLAFPTVNTNKVPSVEIPGVKVKVNGPSGGLDVDENEPATNVLFEVFHWNDALRVSVAFDPLKVKPDMSTLTVSARTELGVTRAKPKAPARAYFLSFMAPSATKLSNAHKEICLELKSKSRAKFDC